MRKTPIALALALAVAAAPAALAGPGKPTTLPASPQAAKSSVPAKGALHLLGGVVITDATADSVAVQVRAANRHMRKALAGAKTVVVKLDENTRIRLVGRARFQPKPAPRLPRVGTFANLTAGDRVIVRIRAPRGTAAADLPAAKVVVDIGPKPTRRNGANGSNGS